MKMSSFNARRSVLLVLFAGTMLVIAGCSSPTGSDTGGAASTITIEGTGPADASDFDGEYTVSKIVRQDSLHPQFQKPVNFYIFCLPRQEGSNSVFGVTWEFLDGETNFVMPVVISTNFIANTKTSPDPDLQKVPLGESMTYAGTVTTPGLEKSGTPGYDFVFVFNINEMPVEEGVC